MCADTRDTGMSQYVFISCFVLFVGVGVSRLCIYVGGLFAKRTLSNSFLLKILTKYTILITNHYSYITLLDCRRLCGCTV